MRVRVEAATSNRDIAVPRPVSRQKSYKSRFGQASTSSNSTCLNNRIDEEEDEDNEMVLGGSTDVLEARAATSKSPSNGKNWSPDGDDYDSDKEEDEEDELNSQEPVVHEIGPQLPGLYDDHHSDDNLPNSGIIVKIISPSDDDLSIANSTDRPSTSQDNQLLIELRVRQYQGNFDGFAEINRFSTIDDMHEFIINNTESALSCESSPKQERYLDILLKERGDDRFRRLIETSRGTVRRLLATNEHILRKLYATANLDNFPSPLKGNVKEEITDDDREEEEKEEEEEEENENDDERERKIIDAVEENMKRWYMIEMIGIWLKFVTDVKSYREAIKKSVLKANCGIENDRYEGIVVPLKYK